MYLPSEIFSLLIIPLCTWAFPTFSDGQIPLAQSSISEVNNVHNVSVRPLVLWHGMGDSYASPGMQEFAKMVQEIHPGIFVHSIFIEENLDADQRAGVFGNLDSQLELVHEQLLGISELADGFDAMGFSQGGLFFRAFVERYNDPPVHNLITFGSPHMGIADLPVCSPTDLMCQLARRAARVGVYSSWAQTNLVQAQYFRDPDQLPTYFASNHFLTSVNNEVVEFLNMTYAQNFATLSKLVLILFSEDKTVVPKESAWFGSYSPPPEEGDESEETLREKVIIPMRLQPLYLADSIGLKKLDNRGDVLLEICEGQHMHLTRECWEPLVLRFTGGTVKKK